MKKKVAIFASGTGSNFERIADDSRLKEIMDIELLVCDRPGAAVIKKAEDRGIKTFVFAARDYNSKEDYEKANNRTSKRFRLYLFSWLYENNISIFSRKL